MILYCTWKYLICWLQSCKAFIPVWDYLISFVFKICQNIHTVQQDHFNRCDSPGGSNVKSLGSTDCYQWTQDSSLAASPAWCVACELRRRLAGRWRLDCLHDCTVPMVVTSIICSKGSFANLYPYLSTKNGSYHSILHSTNRRKRHPKCSKLVINFSQGIAATLSTAGEVGKPCWHL